MKAHSERLRDHAVECVLRSAEAQIGEARLFAKLSADLTDAADQIENGMNGHLSDVALRG